MEGNEKEMIKRILNTRYMRSLLIICLALLLGCGVCYQLTTTHAAHKASASTTAHWLYVVEDGTVFVYDIDNNHALVKQFTIPETGKRGVAVSPGRGMLYVSYCGANVCGGSHGSLLAYDLVNNRVAWNVSYAFGVDQPAITPDGSKIYMPHGDGSDGLTSVLDASNGNVLGSVNTGTFGHNVVASLDGSQVYVAGYTGTNYNYVHVVNPTNNQTFDVGPTLNGVRPFTVNAAHSLLFTTSSNTCGFQVLSITTKAPLYTVPFSGSCAWSASTAPSHGISLSPDERRVYVMDAPLDQLEVYDVSGLPASAPSFVASVPLGSLSGFSSSCQTYCEREGWVLNDLSGRYVYVGDAGNVISTSTLQVVATLPALQNTRQMIEVDWTNGAISATSTRFGLGHGTTSNPPPTATPTAPITTPAGPVARSWYFAEGRIGKGFREYLTIDNPNTTACSVDVTYYYTVGDSTNAPQQTKTVTNVPVAPRSRYTESVNQDLSVYDPATTADNVASVVTMNSASTCAGVMVERPIYFANYHGISSGTDVAGATPTALGRSFSFADVASDATHTSYLTILNPPGGTSATVTATYYASGRVVGTQSTSVPAGGRGTLAAGAITPALPAHSLALVTSTAPVMVERPTYFRNESKGVSGASDVIGAPAPATDWFFAEGYTGTSTQENLTLANPGTSSATAHVTLTSEVGGVNKTFDVPVAAQSQVIWNVNQNNTFGGTPEVSAEVQSTTALVVQREMYFTYHHSVQGMPSVTANGGTDVLGLVGPITKSSYSFAEGYTHPGYNEWLTLQNPTSTAETVVVTLTNGSGHAATVQVTVPANGRQTEDLTADVVKYFNPGSNQSANAIAMTVQTLNGGGTFVAERPEYYNTAGSSFVVQGGTDIIGFGG